MSTKSRQLPAIIATARGVPTIAAAKAPPAPTPLGLDQNFYFRRGIVKSTVTILGLEPEFTEPAGGTYLSEMVEDAEGFYRSYPSQARGWALAFERLIAGRTPSRRDAFGKETPAVRFGDFLEKIEAADFLEQFQENLPAAAARLEEALAPATAAFVHDEVEAFLGGRRAKEKGASGEAFFADVLAVVMDTGATCYAVAAAFQNLRGLAGRDFVDPQSADVVAMVRKWSKNADYAGRIVAGLGALPPASEVRAAIERERDAYQAQLDKEAAEAAERQRQAIEEERQRQAEADARRQEAERRRDEERRVTATGYDPSAAAAGSQWGASGPRARGVENAYAASLARRMANPILSARTWLGEVPRRPPQPEQPPQPARRRPRIDGGA